ncbi:MAG: DUF1761 domain-containing protein [Halieaceae bacterium]|nr:DUF1761 domain-containing protein [Halieaceae bacterium]
MENFTPDPLAVVAAALVGFVIGGLWYSPLLLGGRWMKEAGLSREQVEAGDRRRTFGLSFVALLVMSYGLALFIGPTGAPAEGFYTPSQQGAFHGFLAGFGWVFFAFVVIGLFEQRSRDYILINGGYWIVTMTAMGGILGGMG